MNWMDNKIRLNSFQNVWFSYNSLIFIIINYITEAKFVLYLHISLYYNIDAYLMQFVQVLVLMKVHFNCCDACML